MNKFRAYQHIDNFKNAYKQIISNIPADHGPCYVTASVKIHGTNAGVARIDGKLVPYSRTRIISSESDNYDFAKFVEANTEWFHAAFDKLAEQLPEITGTFLVIYGEYAGPSVQTTVAVSRLPHRMFFPFAVTVVTGDLAEHEHPYYISNMEFMFRGVPSNEHIHPLPRHFETTVDFGNAEQVREFLATVEQLTKQVDEECPIAKSLGIIGNGEGLVWCINYQTRTPDGFEGQQIFFKSKGDSHKRPGERNASKNLLDPGTALTIQEFIAEVLSEDRLHQCVSFLAEAGTPVDIRATGQFLKLVSDDVQRECVAEMEEVGLDWKVVGKHVNGAAAKWFKNHAGGTSGDPT